MDKTSVYLGIEERHRLEVLSRIEQVSQAEIIRRAIRAYEARGAPDRDLAMTGTFDGTGGAVAEVSESELLAGFGE